MKIPLMLAVAAQLTFSFTTPGTGYDVYYVFGSCDSFELHGEDPSKHPNANDYDRKLFQYVRASLSSLNIPHDAKVRIRVSGEGNIEEIVFLSGAVDQKTFAKMESGLGKRLFGRRPDANCLNTIFYTVDIAQLKNPNHEKTSIVSSSPGAFLKTELDGLGKQSICVFNRSERPYTSSDENYDNEIGTIFSALLEPAKERNIKEDANKIGRAMSELKRGQKMSHVALIALNDAIVSCPISPTNSKDFNKDGSAELLQLRCLADDCEKTSFNEKTFDVQNLESLEKSWYALNLKINGYQKDSLGRLAGLLVLKRKFKEYSVLLNHERGYLEKALKTDSPELKKVRLAYVDSLKLSGNTEEAQKISAKIKSDDSDRLAEHRQSDERALDSALQSKKQPSSILVARLNLAKSFYSEANITAAREQLNIAISELSMLTSQHLPLLNAGNSLAICVATLQSRDDENLLSKLILAIELHSNSQSPQRAFGEPSGLSFDYNLPLFAARALLQAKVEKFGKYSQQMQPLLLDYAKILEVNKKFDEAIPVREWLLELSIRNGNLDNAKTYFELAREQLEAGNKSKADSSLASGRKALSAFKGMHDDCQESTVEALMQLGMSFLTHQELAKSELCLLDVIASMPLGPSLRMDMLNRYSKRLTGSLLEKRSYEKSFALQLQTLAIIDPLGKMPSKTLEIYLDLSNSYLHASNLTSDATQSSIWYKKSEQLFLKVIARWDTPDQTFENQQMSRAIDERAEYLREHCIVQAADDCLKLRKPPRDQR